MSPVKIFLVTSHFVITNNCILNRFQQKDIETLQKIAILLLKVLHDEDFDHELQQMC